MQTQISQTFTHAPNIEEIKEVEVKPKGIIGKIIMRLAERPESGIKKVTFEPWGYVGQIEFKSGVRTFFKGSSIGLNTRPLAYPYNSLL